MFHITHISGPYISLSCAHTLKKVDMGNKKIFIPCSGASSVLSFPPILHLLDNVYVRSVCAKLFEG